MGVEGSRHAGAARPEGFEGKVRSLRPPPPALEPLGSGMHTRTLRQRPPPLPYVMIWGGKTCEGGDPTRDSRALPWLFLEQRWWKGGCLLRARLP